MELCRTVAQRPFQIFQKKYNSIKGLIGESSAFHDFYLCSLAILCEEGIVLVTSVGVTVCLTDCPCKNDKVLVGCVAQLAERRSLAGELTLLSCARPAADG